MGMSPCRQDTEQPAPVHFELPRTSANKRHGGRARRPIFAQVLCLLARLSRAPPGKQGNLARPWPFLKPCPLGYIPTYERSNVIAGKLHCNRKRHGNDRTSVEGWVRRKDIVPRLPLVALSG
eukprot:3308084-Amphidinium_carterae.1